MLVNRSTNNSALVGIGLDLQRPDHCDGDPARLTPVHDGQHLRGQGLQETMPVQQGGGAAKSLKVPVWTPPAEFGP
jgi:hypothetical protein